MKQTHEAVVALNAHIKRLQKQKNVLKQKFDYPHSKEFQEEWLKLTYENLSFDKLKEIENIKDTKQKLKALNSYKKRMDFVRTRLKEMEKLSNYWTCENIEKNCEKIADIERKIEQCEVAIMFIPKWPLNKRI